jgi:hypothetical protein
VAWFEKNGGGLGIPHVDLYGVVCIYMYHKIVFTHPMFSVSYFSGTALVTTNKEPPNIKKQMYRSHLCVLFD